MLSKIQLILASSSERRKQLLNQMKLEFLVCPADLNEDREPNETPLEYVERLAIEKAQSIWRGCTRTRPYGLRLFNC